MKRWIPRRTQEQVSQARFGTSPPKPYPFNPISNWLEGERRLGATPTPTPAPTPTPTPTSSGRGWIPERIQEQVRVARFGTPNTPVPTPSPTPSPTYTIMPINPDPPSTSNTIKDDDKGNSWWNNLFGGIGDDYEDELPSQSNGVGGGSSIGAGGSFSADGSISTDNNVIAYAIIFIIGMVLFLSIGRK